VVAPRMPTRTALVLPLQGNTERKTMTEEPTPDVIHQPATVEEMLDAYQRHTRQLIAVLDSIVAATRTNTETERKETR